MVQPLLVFFLVFDYSSGVISARLIFEPMDFYMIDIPLSIEYNSEYKRHSVNVACVNCQYSTSLKYPNVEA